MRSLPSSVARIPSAIWVLLAIMLLGIGLRTYQFHDWLRFNNDQARDAALTSEILTGQVVPLLGPKAGGTEFRLGPAFYYIQAASGKIFGNYPDALAYPELFFSILTIVLLFFFLRRYFSEKISLLLALMGAISYFAVRYGRFSWNPNAEPFWTLLLLFSLLKVFDSKTNRRYLWSITGGLALGVAVQLHTLLLVTLPVYLLVIFGYAIFRKMPLKKYFLVMVLTAALLNVPQLVDFSKTGGKNIQAFFQANKAKQSRNTSVFDSLFTVAQCSLQANIHIVSGLGDNDVCSFFRIEQKNISEQMGAVLTLFLGMVLACGGLFLLASRLTTEEDDNRRRFLMFTALYGLLSLLVLIPVAHEISIRFYLGLYFIPFILLGLCFEWLHARSWKSKTAMLVFVAVLFSLSNLKALGDDFISVSSDARGLTSIMTLGDLEGLTSALAKHADPSRLVMIDGKKNVLFHLYRPLAYIASLHHLTLSRYDDTLASLPTTQIFLIRLTNEHSDETERAISLEKVGRYTLIETQ